MNPEELQDTGLSRHSRMAGWLALGALLLCGLGAWFHPAQFYHSWLVALIFGLSIALGALFLNMVFHLTGAEWSLPIRRLLENLGATLPLLCVLVLPLLAGISELYPWSRAAIAAEDHLIQLKTPFLNPPFFIVRTLIYLGVWTLLALRLRAFSLKAENGVSGEWPARMRKLSAGGVILFGLTVTFAAFDWLMSLDAHWYSTIFGLYLFSGFVVAGLAGVILLARYLQGQGHLTGTVQIETYHDLGRMLLTFTIFWAYMAVSQYFLIWYGNIPEETIWYQHRWHGSWQAVSLLLVFGHFTVPFLLLLTRWAKRNLLVLSLLSGWLLLMHGVDLYWLVMPGLHAEGVVLSWQDLAALVGVMGSMIWYLRRISGRHPLAVRPE